MTELSSMASPSAGSMIRNESGLNVRTPQPHKDSVPSRERVLAAIALVRSQQLEKSKAPVLKKKVEMGASPEKPPDLSPFSKHLEHSYTQPRSPLAPVDQIGRKEKSSSDQKMILAKSGLFFQNVFASRSEVLPTASNAALPSVPMMTDDKQAENSPADKPTFSYRPSRTMSSELSSKSHDRRIAAIIQDASNCGKMKTGIFPSSKPFGPQDPVMTDSLKRILESSKRKVPNHFPVVGSGGSDPHALDRDTIQDAIQYLTGLKSRALKQEKMAPDLDPIEILRCGSADDISVRLLEDLDPRRKLESNGSEVDPVEVMRGFDPLDFMNEDDYIQDELSKDDDSSLIQDAEGHADRLRELACAEAPVTQSADLTFDAPTLEASALFLAASDKNPSTEILTTRSTNSSLLLTSSSSKTIFEQLESFSVQVSTSSSNDRASKVSKDPAACVDAKVTGFKPYPSAPSGIPEPVMLMHEAKLASSESNNKKKVEEGGVMEKGKKSEDADKNCLRVVVEEKHLLDPKTIEDAIHFLTALSTPNEGLNSKSSNKLIKQIKSVSETPTSTIMDPIVSSDAKHANRHAPLDLSAAVMMLHEAHIAPSYSVESLESIPTDNVEGATKEEKGINVDNSCIGLSIDDNEIKGREKQVERKGTDLENEGFRLTIENSEFRSENEGVCNLHIAKTTCPGRQNSSFETGSDCADNVSVNVDFQEETIEMTARYYDIGVSGVKMEQDRENEKECSDGIVAQSLSPVLEAPSAETQNCELALNGSRCADDEPENEGIAAADSTSFEKRYFESSQRPRPGRFWNRVLFSIIILNVSAEFVDTIVIEQFSNSLSVAVTLAMALESIDYAERKVQYLFSSSGRTLTFIGFFFMFFIIYPIIFLILFLDDVICGIHVEFHGLREFSVLTCSILFSEKMSKWIG